MICEACQEERATVHLTQIIMGTTRTSDFCKECATKQGVTDPDGFSLREMLLGVRAGTGTKDEGDRLRERTTAYWERLIENKSRYPFHRWRKLEALGRVQYSKANCDAAEATLDEMLRGLHDAGERATEDQKLVFFESAIRTLNLLHNRTGCSLIETSEREDLCELFYDIAVCAGIDCTKFESGDITLQWHAQSKGHEKFRS